MMKDIFLLKFGMSEKEFTELLPLELKLIFRIGVTEASTWYEHFKSKGVWPTVQEVYFMRYLKGDHKGVPFPILRKFIMQDAGLTPEDKEIKLWSHR